MAINSFSFFPRHLRAVVCLILIPAAFGFVSPTAAVAQTFTLSLDDLSGFYSDVPWDTVETVPLGRLRLGAYHTVPNFLDSDFARLRVLEEYPPQTSLRVKFKYPNIYRFEFGESREGSFIVLSGRDLDTPGLEIDMQTVDDIATRRLRESREQVWRETVTTSLNLRTTPVQTRRGMLNIQIPVALPSAVERIIGKGEATNIDISGRESITFSGESRRVSPFIGVEGQQKQPLFPSLDMKQELDVRLNGQIGEKVNIQVDHSSAAIGPNANRIRLNYTGFDDDIVQLIELGNTTLSLPGSELVSFSSQSQGLFGIKALAQVGPMDFTVIASKEEGEVSQATFTPRGGSIGQTEERSIRDIDFVKNVYFFLDRPPSADYPNNFFLADQATIEVYVSVPDGQAADFNAKRALAFVDTTGRGDDIRAAVAALESGGTVPPSEDRQFRLLQLRDDYRYVLDAETQDVIGIEMIRSVPQGQALGVRYVNVLGDTIGDIGNENEPIILELIWASSPLPTGPYGFTWAYMMRHIYNLGLSNIDGETLELDILDNSLRLDPSTPDSSTVPWIRVFGLDRTDESGVGPPDNRIDLNTVLIDLQSGILTFPILTPFNPPDDSVAAWTDGQFAFTGQYADIRRPEIYTDFLTRPEDFQRFRIDVRAASTTKTFSIDAFNITEGSEVVTLDGRTLTRNRDYTIDYDTGEVELIGDVVGELTPSSNITIDYEFKPFAGGGTSSLIGFNSLLNLSKHSKFGTTWLYESKASAADRPRLGEEPSRIIVGDVNGSVQFSPGFLTRLVNTLPLVNTDARSALNLSGEVAVSMPDPNTKGEVYIDDFEGVEDSDIFSLTRRTWYPASPPISDDGTTPLPADDKEKVFWYNIEPERGVHARDLNPDLDERESSLLPSLDIELDTVTVDSTRWTGVMTGFRGSGLDLSQGQFIEIWVNDFKPDSLDRSGKIHIDMGFIDEDFYEPDVTPPTLNTEDVNRDGFSAFTEDTGLDNIFNDDPDFGPGDPDDDYEPRRIGGRFSQINGTERNGLLDTEDLDGNGQLDPANAYFTFDVDLAATAITDIRRDFPSFIDFADPSDSWRLYRIDLADFRVINKDAEPVFEQIKHLRIWIDDINTVVNPSKRRLQIVGFKVVGNRWELDGIRALNDTLRTPAETAGTVLKLGVINTKTDPTRYVPPVTPNQENDIFEREQSLLVVYDSLRASDAFRIRKRFPGRGQDYTTYRDLNFWVHTDKLDSELEYFFRIAFDSLNYYEVAIPLTATFFEPNGWSRVLIDLTEITDLKFAPKDSAVTGTATDLADPAKGYPITLVGNPSLFNVRFFYAGLRNKSPANAVSGELWINDIFLGNRKRDIDFAQRFSGTLNMGNIINFNASWRQTGPDFRGLRARRGSGSNNQALSMNVKTAVQHFIPLFGFRLPVSANYSRSVSLPKFTPNSDTEITEASRQDSLRTESSVRGFSTTLTRSGSKFFLMKYTFDKLKTNFSMSQSRRRSPASADTTVSMTGTLDYSITWGQGHFIPLFKGIRFRYWPNSMNLRVNATRRTGTRYRLVGGQFVADPESFAATLTQSGSISYIPFSSLTMSFRGQLQRDPALPHTWRGLEIGLETNRSHSFQANYKPPPVWLIGVFSPDIAFNSSYREDSSPNVRRAGDPFGVRNVSNNRDTSLKLAFDLGKYLRRFLGVFDLVEEDKKPPTPPRGRPANETADSDTTKTGGRPSAMTPLRKVGNVFANIRRINASARQRVQSSYSRIGARPSLEYQFGLTNDSGVIVAGVPVSSPERTSESLTISADTGTQVTRNIDVAARYTTTISKSGFRESETRAVNTTWPDVNLSWKGLEKIGPFRGLFTSTSANLGFRKTKRETGRGSGDPETINETRQITPTIVFTWKNGLTSNLNMSLVRNANDTRGSISETNSLDISLDMKYSFAAGKSIRLPFLRGKTLKSKLDSSLSMGYSRNRGRRLTAGSGFFEPLPGSNLIRVSPRLTYNFTRALNGSFFIDYSRAFSEATNQTTTTLRVGINAIFTF